jgi:hypothetical protein
VVEIRPAVAVEAVQGDDGTPNLQWVNRLSIGSGVVVNESRAAAEGIKDVEEGDVAAGYCGKAVWDELPGELLSGGLPKAAKDDSRGREESGGGPHGSNRDAEFLASAVVPFCTSQAYRWHVK